MERGKMSAFGFLLMMAFLTVGSQARSSNETVDARVAKALNVFSVVKFPNDVCTATNGFNGTCYTADECSSKSGTSSGSCASGFGVCCTFSLACGSTTGENNTYFDQAAFTTWGGSSSPCKYTICPASGVCRIRLDLTSFVIADPVTKGDTADTGSGMGKCSVESFTVTTPGMTPPPEICGTNTGQHMFLDVNSANCIDVSININTLDTSTSRKWSIHAKQYECGSAIAGPTGCLQYHTGSFGLVATFNFDMSGTTTAILASTTHLASQDYDICFRREEGKCRNCFSPKFATSFGVSSAPSGTIAQAGSGVTCVGSAGYADFVEIPGAQVYAQSSTSSEYTTKSATIGHSRICGRIFSNVDAATADVTICTHAAPFKLHVNTDDGELIANGGTFITSEATVPATTSPTGSDGFYLEYFQETC